MAGEPITNQPPNWEQVTLELQCPRCGYNLRMLTGCRCPECGLDLEWGRLIASAEKRVDSPFFEYQWRTRPLRSYLFTLRRCIWPWQLWTRLSVMDEPQLVPLFAFGVSTVLLYVLLPVATFAARMSIIWNQVYSRYMPLRGLVREIAERLLSWLNAATVHLLLGLTIWLFLQVFQQTIAAYKIRHRQLARVVCYSVVPVFVLKLIQALMELNAYFSGTTPLQFWAGNYWAVAFDSLCLYLVGRSLSLALTQYLQVRRGGYVAVAVLFLSGLTWTVGIILISVIVGDWNNPIANTVYYNWSGADAAISRLLGL